MPAQSLLTVFSRIRGPRIAALCLLLSASFSIRVSGQDSSRASIRASIPNPESGKVWTEDDLAGLLKPWDLYRIAEEKKAALSASAPIAQESSGSSNLTSAAPVSPEIAVSSNNAILRATDSRQFQGFLKMLDTDLTIWQARLDRLDVGSLAFESQEQEEIEKRYDSCQEALKRARDEMTKVSQNQTLKLDILLLIDLNTLARNLDGLTVNLASPLTAQDMNTAQKSLEWAKEGLRIDEELAPRISQLQFHTVDLASAWEAALAASPTAVEQEK